MTGPEPHSSEKQVPWTPTSSEILLGTDRISAWQDLGARTCNPQGGGAKVRPKWALPLKLSQALHVGVFTPLEERAVCVPVPGQGTYVFARTCSCTYMHIYECLECVYK